MSTPAAPQVGDTKKGHVFTETGWLPTKPPKKKHTVRNLLLAFVVITGLGIAGCTALVGGAANEISKSIEEDANKPGGTDNPMPINEGKPFEVDGFKYAAGWSIGKDALGDLDVKGLKVTNNRDDKDSALVEIKLWQGTEVKALADCTTEPIGVGTTVSLSCLSTDKLPKSFDKITINDTF
ncbi:hypothetical protein IEZ26_07875 [Nocardioides cavernae]|uniref:DUF4333 domain-containing protein n=1 Tax=Nocardioides cavernae TaxID=1921566 RepID=A0ABR8NAB2_9ACTN|nr:hypothetical protein [Nocardioides cavernae]MBD3924532.1 hypothetical protein [Nocardioides cavernae]MBM7510521.1 hypothetical protein [Nocardioides cavernae]